MARIRVGDRIAVTSLFGGMFQKTGVVRHITKQGTPNPLRISPRTWYWIEWDDPNTEPCWMLKGTVRHVGNSLATNRRQPPPPHH